jgi:hypothetical protein
MDGLEGKNRVKMRGDNNESRNAVSQASARNADESNAGSVVDRMVTKYGLLVVRYADDAA